MSFSNFVFLQKKCGNCYTKLWKMRKFKQITFFKIISPRQFNLQRFTIPHLKALDLLFRPLTWLLTQGSIVIMVWCKTFVYSFFVHPRFKKKDLPHQHLMRLFSWDFLKSIHTIHAIRYDLICPFLTQNLDHWQFLQVKQQHHLIF